MRLVDVARDFGNPTLQATHVPYRSWCPVCVTAISFHCKAFGQEDDRDNKANEWAKTKKKT